MRSPKEVRDNNRQTAVIEDTLLIILRNDQLSHKHQIKRVNSAVLTEIAVVEAENSAVSQYGFLHHYKISHREYVIAVHIALDM